MASQGDAEFVDFSVDAVAINSTNNTNALPPKVVGPTAQKSIFIVLLLLNAAFICANVWVMFKCIYTKKLHRVTSILISNFAGISICIALINTCCPGEKALLFTISGPLCTIIPYWKSVLLTALPINLVLIIYVRLSHRREHKVSVRALLLAGLIWSVSILFNIPVFGMAKARESAVGNGEHGRDQNFSGTYPESCERTNLFGQPFATSVYELTRFLIFHVAVILYMLYAVVTIGLKLSYLYRTSANATNQRRRRKVRSISLAVVHVVSLAFLWLPLGLFLFHRRVVGRQVVGESTPELARDFRGAYGSIFVLLYFYIQITPLVSLRLLLYTPNEEVNRRWPVAFVEYFANFFPATCTHLAVCKRRKSQRRSDLGRENIRNTETGLDCKWTGNTSRVSTFEISKECSKFGSKCESAYASNQSNGF